MQTLDFCLSASVCLSASDTSKLSFRSCEGVQLTWAAAKLGFVHNLAKQLMTPATFSCNVLTVRHDCTGITVSAAQPHMPVDLGANYRVQTCEPNGL